MIVDLNSISDYEDHKDKLKGVLDLAVLGEFVHVGGSAVQVDVWMTPGPTNYTTAAAVMSYNFV